MAKCKKKRCRRPARTFEPPVVQFRQIAVDFENRTVEIDGELHTTPAPCMVIPILSGEAIFLPVGFERVR